MAWSKGIVEWRDRERACLSVVFTWDLPAAYQRAVWLGQYGIEVVADGPAVRLMPEYLADVAVCRPWADPEPAVWRHNPVATFTSRGCPNRCEFCAVWRIEEFRELDDWPLGPVVCDNNLLACSRKHFDLVVDRLKPVKGIDFNQGLDAAALDKYRAGRLAELDCRVIRLACDSIHDLDTTRAAIVRLQVEGIPKKKIRVYCLIGFDEGPAETLARLREIAKMGIDPFPMRYNPLDTLQRDSYVGPGWTDRNLTRFMRYWANLRYFRAVPFEEFDR